MMGSARHPAGRGDAPGQRGGTVNMPETTITLETPVEEVMRRFPATIAVFLRHRMHCIGCAIGPFHTVLDASREYDLPAATMLRELRAEAGADRPAAGLATG